MSLASVLAPVFVQVALTYALLIGLIVTRALSERLGRAGPGGEEAWSRRAAWVARSYANQLELPVVFFALVALALAAQETDTVFVMLEWIYVAARLAQAAVHVTVNVVPLRGAFFFVSAVVLGIAWIRFGAAVLG